MGARMVDNTIGRLHVAYFIKEHPEGRELWMAIGEVDRITNDMVIDAKEHSLALSRTTPEKAASKVASLLAKEDHRVYGSFTVTQLIPKTLPKGTTAGDVRRMVGRLPSDIDIFVNDPGKFVPKLLNKLKKTGLPVRRVKDSIEIKIGGKWDTMYDIHAMNTRGSPYDAKPGDRPASDKITIRNPLSPEKKQPWERQSAFDIHIPAPVARPSSPAPDEIKKTGKLTQECYVHQVTQRKAAAMTRVVLGETHAGRVKDVYDYISGVRRLAAEQHRQGQKEGNQRKIRIAARLNQLASIMENHPLVKKAYREAKKQSGATAKEDTARIKKVIKTRR